NAPSGWNSNWSVLSWRGGLQGNAPTERADVNGGIDLPGFPETLISRKMAPAGRGAYEESRFSEEQMIAILREADRTAVAEAEKKAPISDAITTTRASRSRMAPTRASTASQRRMPVPRVV